MAAAVVVIIVAVKVAVVKVVVVAAVVAAVVVVVVVVAAVVAVVVGAWAGQGMCLWGATCGAGEAGGVGGGTRALQPVRLQGRGSPWRSLRRGGCTRTGGAGRA